MVTFRGVKSITKSSLRSCWVFLLTFIKLYFKECLICVLFFTVSCWLSGILVNEVLETLVDSLSLNKNVLSLLLLFAGCHIVAEITTYIGKLIYSTVLPKIEMNIRLSLFWYVQHLSMQYFHYIDAGILENTIDNAAEGTREAMEDIVSEIIPSLVFALVSNIYLFCLNWQIGCLYFVGIILFCCLYLLLAEKVLDLGKKAFKIINQRTGLTVEIMQNIKLTRILHLENYTLNKMHNISELEMKCLRSYFASAAHIGFVTSILLVICNGLLIFLIIFILQSKIHLSSGKLIAIINMLFSTSYHLWNASKQTMDVFLNISRISQSLNRLFVAPENEIMGDLKNIPVENIQIKNLTFSYGSQVIIKKLSLSIPRGMKVCIMGQSGSGKTTLLNILSKMIAIPDRSVFVDGVDLNKINPVFYRSKLSYITQSNFMFHASILENITVGKTANIPMEDVIDVAKKAGVHDFIMNLPNKYDSDVGVNSSFLSGGQIQRLCIARALMNKGDIIICDEPTSAIDGITAVKIIQNIFEISKNKTLIWVDHSTLVSPLVDLIILFQSDKKIVTGTHRELLQSNLEYQKIFNKNNLSVRSTR